jgi:NSS family neurotransmitter:Na+ symporter
MSYILPAIIVVVYLKGYYDTFAGMGTNVLIGWMIFAVALLAAIFVLAFYRKNNKRGNET